jgi:hypothetical protein
MFLSKKVNAIVTKSGVAVFIIIFLSSCDSLWKEKEVKVPLARVGESYLYKEDIQSLLSDNISKVDSASFVTNYINNWAAQQLLFAKSKINLPETELAKFDRLVANYRADLYTGAYKEALVQQSHDTVISPTELYNFYEREKENFKLKEQIVRLKFIELPLQFLDKERVSESFRRFNEKDAAYLDSIGVQFKKLNFNDSVWVSTSRIIAEIPPLTFENQDRYLKKSQFFELQDSLGLYLAKVTDVLKANEIAPLPYIEPTIKQVLMNKRRLDFLRNLETEIIDEAIKRKEFEVYAQDQ